MRNGIPAFRPRQSLDRQLSATTLNDIRKELESLRITQVVNGSFRKLPGGTEITVAPQRGGTASEPQPWEIYVSESVSENSVKLKVRPGLVSQILPSNYEAEFTANTTALHYGIVKLTTDGQYITGATIEIRTTQPITQAATKFGLAANIEVLFGLFKEGESFNLTGGKPIDLSSRNVLATVASPQNIYGTPMYDLWFRLQ